MNHPELFVVPILMVIDYSLTILGAKAATSVYRKHFVTASYELNPVWRKSVNQIRWFNPRHFMLVLLVTALLIVVDQLAGRRDSSCEFTLGIFFGVFGTLCGRHLTNLLLFHYLQQHPHEISGQVQLSMKLTLKLSQFSVIGIIPLLAIVAVLVPHSYTLGACCGLIVLAFAHMVWGLRSRPVEIQGEQPIEAELVDADG